MFEGVVVDDVVVAVPLAPLVVGTAGPVHNAKSIKGRI